MTSTSDYQQGYYEGVSKVREFVEDAMPSEIFGHVQRQVLTDVLVKIDALLHAPPEI